MRERSEVLASHRSLTVTARIHHSLGASQSTKERGRNNFPKSYKPDAQDVTLKVKWGGGDAPWDFWCWQLIRVRRWYDTMSICGSRGTLERKFLEDGEGKLMLLAMCGLRGRVDSVARGAYADGPSGGWRSALRKRNRPRAARWKVSWGRQGDLFLNRGLAL